MEPYFSLFVQAKVTNLAYECIFFGVADLFVLVHRVALQDGTGCVSTGRGRA
jgi:hypothetical protein